jgi:K+ potassium transporter
MSGEPKSSSDSGVRPTRIRQTAHVEPTGRRLAVLSFTALGIVYGDIGTSPLYAFREVFHPERGIAPTVEAVHGLLSMIVWSLILIVSIKYVARTTVAKVAFSRCWRSSRATAVHGPAGARLGHSFRIGSPEVA